MSDQNQTNPSFDDLCKLLHITSHSDGTITRHDTLALALHTSPISDSTSPILSKDVTLNQTNNTWARIYMPNKAFSSSSPSTKLPLIIYFHCGGFILFSAASSLLQNFCEKIASEIPAVVFSVSYRLAPENRLPAQYDDAMEAFQWIKDSEDVWLRQYADYGNCFVLGSSSGGNIVYHACLRVAEEGHSNLDPLKIKGLILQEPFFGGIEKTESEVRNEGDPLLVRGITDLMWEFALPVGADRDHEYCNPSGSKGLDIMKLNEWRVLVTGFEEDPLVDRQKEVARMMKEKGVKVKGEFRGGGCHGIELLDPTKCQDFVLLLKDFVQRVVCCN